MDSRSELADPTQGGVTRAGQVLLLGTGHPPCVTLGLEDTARLSADMGSPAAGWLRAARMQGRRAPSRRDREGAQSPGGAKLQPTQSTARGQRGAKGGGDPTTWVRRARWGPGTEKGARQLASRIKGPCRLQGVLVTGKASQSHPQVEGCLVRVSLQPEGLHRWPPGPVPHGFPCGLRVSFWKVQLGR